MGEQVFPIATTRAISFEAPNENGFRRIVDIREWDEGPGKPTRAEIEKQMREVPFVDSVKFEDAK